MVSGLRAGVRVMGDSCETFWAVALDQMLSDSAKSSDGGSSEDEKEKLKDILELKSAQHGKPVA